MKNDEEIFKRGNLTDFEKLLFALENNKELKVEIGKLKSDVQELQDIIDYGGKEFLKKIRRENSTLIIENKRLEEKVKHLNTLLENE